jgi:hypothetical protein
MLKHIFLFPISIFLFVSCGLLGTVFDPVEKYEKAGYNVSRFFIGSAVDNPTLYAWQISNWILIDDGINLGEEIFDINSKQIVHTMDIDRYLYKDFMSEHTFSDDGNNIFCCSGDIVLSTYSISNSLLQTNLTLPAYSYSNSLIAITPDNYFVFASYYTNYKDYSYKIDEGWVFIIKTPGYTTNVWVLDTNGNTLTNFSGMKCLPPFVVSYDTKNVFAQDTDGNIVEFDIENKKTTKYEIPDLQGIEYYLQSVSTKGKYLIIRKAFTYQDKIDDKGLSIVDLSNKTVTDLFKMSNLGFDANELVREGGADNLVTQDVKGFISPDLKTIAFAIQTLPGFESTTSTRDPNEDLPGLWYLDISSLNLTE